MSRRASAALRVLAPFATAGIDTASGDDLANAATQNLPNHAMAWGGDTLYQLDKSLSGAPAVGQIAPNVGPGLWVPIIISEPAVANTVETFSVTNTTLLAEIDTTDLPDNTMAWGGDTLYQLDTSLSPPAEGNQVAPDTGPGLWVPIVGPLAALLNFTIHTPDSGGVRTITSGGVRPLPDLAYVIVGAASILPFTFDTNGAVLTYTGSADRYFNFRAGVKFTAAADPGPFQTQFYINGLGGTTIVPNATVGFFTVLGGGFQAMAYVETKLVLSTGDTIQIGTSTKVQDCDLQHLSWTVDELPQAAP